MEPDRLSDLISLFEKGGIVMYPLLICVFISAYVCVERLIFLREGKLLNRESFDFWSLQLQQKNFREFASSNFRYSLLTKLIGNLKTQLPLTEIALDEKIRMNFAEIRLTLEKRLHWLEIVTHVSPLMGLLGTALGMLQIFSSLSSENISTGLLSIGISEALITTITGLSIAIPSLIAHSLFQKKIEQILFHLETQMNALIFEFRETFIIEKGE